MQNTNSDQDYYAVKAISNSSLRFIDPEEGGSPQMYKDFIDGNLDFKESPALIFGRMLHEYNLEPEIFGFVEITKMPSDKVLPALPGMVDALLNQELFPVDSKEDFEDLFPNPDFIELWSSLCAKHLHEADYGRSYKEETRYKKAMVEGGGNEWIAEHLRTRDLKIVSFEDYERMKACSASIKNNPTANYLIFGDEDDEEDSGVLSFNEKEVYYSDNHPDFPLARKGKLDRLLVDTKNKEFHIVDLKTTGSSIDSFGTKLNKDSYKRPSFFAYGYDRQIASYEQHAIQWLEQNGYSGYTFGKHYIVAVESFKYYRCRVFTISRDVIVEGYKKYNSLIERIRFHTANNMWTETKEILENHGQIQEITLEDGNDARRSHVGKGQGVKSSTPSKIA